MLLSEAVHVERRYQRSINIEQDFANGSALEGYIFPGSAKSALLNKFANGDSEAKLS